MLQRINYTVLIVALGCVALLVPAAAAAQTDVLEVEYEATPLFQSINILPGDTESRTVTVTNNGEATESVYVSVSNVSVPGSGTNLADVLELTITHGATTYYDDTFTNFFGDIPVDLGSLSAGDSRVYTLEVSLDTSVGNPYQSLENSFAFDLVTGFSGGESTTDNDDDDDNDDGGGGGSGSSGGGGQGGDFPFRIFSEELVATTAGAATIGWETNLPGTTYLVCGALSGGPYTLDANDPQLGYPRATTEVFGDTRNHTATIAGLSPATYECVPVSRPDASAEYTTGVPIIFSLLPDGQVAGAAAATALAGTGGPVATESDSGAVAGSATAAPAGDAATTGLSFQAASLGSAGDVLQGLTATDCTLLWLLLLLLFTLAASLVDDTGWRRGTVLQKRYLLSSVGFAAIYALVVIALNAYELLAAWWALPAVAWLIYTGFDYARHHEDEMWNPRSRHIAFLIVALALVGVHFLLGWPCVWLPFALIGVGTLLVWLVDHQKPQNLNS